MANNETEETTDEGNDEFVTFSQLEAILDEKLSGFVDKFAGDNLPETDTTDEADEVVGNLSPADIEALIEKRVAGAMQKLAQKKATRPATKKAAPKPPPAKEESTKTDDDESRPNLPGKKSLSERLWGK